MKKVGLVIASEGFQYDEYSLTKEIIESSNEAEVITISNQVGTAAANDNKNVITVDSTLEQVDTTKLDGLFFIGGPGALQNLDNSKSYNLLQQMNILKKPLGAICISVRILAKAGVLINKNATGWNDDGLLQNIFKQNRVNFIENKLVVTDGSIVTAQGPNVAVEFGREILCVLNVLNCQL